jgi:hypothetical protein
MSTIENMARATHNTKGGGYIAGCRVSRQISEVNEHFIYRCGSAADWRAQSVPP